MIAYYRLYTIDEYIAMQSKKRIAHIREKQKPIESIADVNRTLTSGVVEASQ